MKLKTDENLPNTIAELLREAGHDALTVAEQGLGGHNDTNVAAVCMSEGRALVTLDVGFANVQAYPPADYAGLVVLRLTRQDKASALSAVRRIMPLLDQEPLRGRLWIVDEARLRIRS